MNEDRTTDAKVAKPHAHFEGPADVVIDPGLSKNQKKEVLDTMEQDARQLLDASSEGMTGGEPNNLHEVLDAKDSLELPPVAQAYDVVLKDLRSTLHADLGQEERTAVEQALTALAAVARATAIKPDPRVVTTEGDGTLMPGSKAEMEDEIAREKLDP
jgi:hypothetical protein